METGEQVGVEAVPYCCSACDGGETPACGLACRTRKTRSLSTSSATACDYRKNQSLHGTSPVTTFGPKACMLQNPHAVMHIQDPASQRLTWNKPPKSVLVIKKIQDASLLQPFKELCVFLTEKNMIVYVERKVLADPVIQADESFAAVIQKFCTFREDLDDISNRVDFIICLGGDGTLLYASSLFQSVPPVMSFHLGSLGFLTPFNFDTYQSQVTQIIEGNAAIILRSRLRVVKESREKNARVDKKGIIMTKGDSEGSRKAMQYQVLNEVVVDRGPFSYLSNVDLFLDGHLITTVQGDGVIVSTPTGSTAYAVAAGASMIHPNVPAIMITPICPHSLSFRPIVVPAGVELKIMLSRDSRNTAWVSFDGRKRQEICHGDKCVTFWPLSHCNLPPSQNTTKQKLINMEDSLMNSTQSSSNSRKHYHHYFLLPRSLHLFPGSRERLVREPGTMFTLECEKEAELP
ncbi:NAD kinase isoform X2 [Oncorhynchus tshawytscha]|uniref:NAD kinase isoform X2 n=1 Tax=Oncorhynchus tshawytscha TaxID=74940 RepID=UPI001C3DB739|nr:NAD kinase isoform X2 [Oncorhynchus tshawytscha]